MDFKIFFSAGKRGKFPKKSMYYFPQYLQYVATLPYESWKKMQTKI